MTPDGISTEDWDRVQAHALQVVNSSAEADDSASDAASLRLRELLDDLQRTWCGLPLPWRPSSSKRSWTSPRARSGWTSWRVISRRSPIRPK